jgi:hypothetical protein
MSALPVLSRPRGVTYGERGLDGRPVACASDSHHSAILTLLATICGGDSARAESLVR